MSQKTDSARVQGGEPRLSRASVGRLSLYLRALENLLREGMTTISSSVLGDAIGVSDAQVRKDLASLGSLGHPGVGYSVPELVAVIRRVLGIDRDWRVVLVGVGNLARALLRYDGFLQRGFRTVALFDADPSKVGQRVNDLEIYPPERMASVIAETGAELGILTVPADQAQEVANVLLAAGIRGFLSFAPNVVRVPPGVPVVSVDLTFQLEQLSFLVQLGRTEL